MTSPQVDSATTSYHNISTCPTQREAVLILAYGDGWIEAFAEKHVDVRIEIVPCMTTPAGAILAEEYVELSLPKKYRDIYWPGNRRAAEMMRVVRPSDIARRDFELDVLHSIEEAGAILRGNNREGRKVWTL